MSTRVRKPKAGLVRQAVHYANFYSNTRPLLEGENHIPGYNFCGPGTQFEARTIRGDQPVNELDACCQEHDRVYNDRQATGKEIQVSDTVLRQCIRYAKKQGLSERAAHLVMEEIFKGKRLMEDIGVLDPKHFSAK